MRIRIGIRSSAHWNRRASLALGACAPKKPPVARPLPPRRHHPGGAAAARPAGPDRGDAGRHGPPVVEDPLASRSVDELNRDSPMRVAYFDYDSAELSAEARAALDATPRS